MFSYLLELISLVKREKKEIDEHTPDTVIQVDPNDMTIDIESGHLILVTHISNENHYSSKSSNYSNYYKTNSNFHFNYEII
jgi:hypothetical protein